MNMFLAITKLVQNESWLMCFSCFFFSDMITQDQRKIKLQQRNQTLSTPNPCMKKPVIILVQLPKVPLTTPRWIPKAPNQSFCQTLPLLLHHLLLPPWWLSRSSRLRHLLTAGSEMTPASAPLHPRTGSKPRSLYRGKPGLALAVCNCSYAHAWFICLP